MKIKDSILKRKKLNIYNKEKRSNKHKKLLHLIADMDNLRLAYKLATKSTKNISYLEFKEQSEYNLYLINKEILDSTYKLGEYYTFPVYDPKLRIISALPFRDRVVQHAINNIINPIFEKTFYSSSYACRKGKGTHSCVRKTQSTIRKLKKTGEVYVLKMDFSKYFNSINPDILMTEIKRKIKDKDVLNLLDKFIDSSGGIRVGNLLSQLFANIYGHIFDRYIKSDLRIKYYYRYMDDTIILSNNKEELIELQKDLQEFALTKMKLKFSKWYISNVESKSINFIGYRIRANYKLIRKDSVLRAKRKIKKYKLTKNVDKMNSFIASWSGHIKMADSKNLKNYINKELDDVKFKTLY